MAESTYFETSKQSTYFETGNVPVMLLDVKVLTET